ncbi:oxytocin receptor-like [Babylonia areolata]|uniref:oxytocin receptor-like n=1 Tax=Babylonia areolata TaxID=304850 RepID=UPI003FD20ECF
MDDDHVIEVAGLDTKIFLPDTQELQPLQGRSTPRPVVSVVYRVITANLTSPGNASSFGNASSNASLLGVYERNEDLARIEVAVLATIFALAVVGNVCVLVALGRRRKITSRMHMFILHLSVADLLVALCNILPQLAWDLTGTFRGGDFLCRTVTFLQVFVMYLSTYVLVMTAIDRYRAICFPLSNHNWTPRTVNLLVLGVYLVSAVFSIPQPLLFRYQVRERMDGVEDCRATFEPPWLLHAYILSFTALVYILPFLFLLFTYGSICYTIWAHHSTPTTLKRLTTWGIGSPGGGRAGGGRNGVVRPRAHSVRGFSRAKLKTVKLTFVVIVAYLVCWSPFFISHICWLYDPQQESNSAVVIMVLLSSLNSCCNPWIYLAFSGNLLKHLLPCRLPSCSRSPSSPHPHHPYLHTTSPSRQQGGMEMVGMAPRPRPDRHTSTRTECPGAHSTTFCRAHNVGGGDQGRHHQNPPPRHSSMTSLLTSRHTSAALRRRQSQTLSDPSPGVAVGTTMTAMTMRDGGGHLFEGSTKKNNGSQADKTAANGCAGGMGKLPSALLLRHTNTSADEGSTSVSQGSKESSGSSSNPRSPHLCKRTRLHERPPEEVAEAQLKWEHHTGSTGQQAASCFTYGADTD